MPLELTTGAQDVPPVVSLTNCDREPIHIPGSIQPHGVLLVLAGTSSRVIQVSQNVDVFLGASADELLEQPLSRAIGADVADSLMQGISRAPSRGRSMFLRTVRIQAGGQTRLFHAIVHRPDDHFVLELEADTPTSSSDSFEPGIYAQVDAYTLLVEDVSTVTDLCHITAKTVRELTGFDRVLIYQFDPEWNGIVVGEDGNGRLPSLLQHRFPASDIPAQARELYRSNRLRIIPDASYRPVPLVPALNPQTDKPLDMTFATLRSVSPIHVEYMRNMETASSMSVSILQGGNLWGLISCHHREPKTVPFLVRGTCDLIARAFSLRLSALDRAFDFKRGIEVKSIYSKLFETMTDRGDFTVALTENTNELLAFAGAQGAAVVTENSCLLVGNTPSEKHIRELATWLFETQRKEVYSTDSLSQEFPPAENYADVASGLLAIAVSKIHPSYVVWFRPEVIQTIQWGGDPRKQIETVDGEVKIQPRRSFETWKETVRRRSYPWAAGELEGARELRSAIVGVVLRKAEEIADLNQELTRSNRELEAFSYSVSHDLRAPLRHIVGYAEILKESVNENLTDHDRRCINTIIESSEYAGKLVEKLLEYSRLGRSELHLNLIDMNVLVGEIRADVMRDAENRSITWNIRQLPSVKADLVMLRMAVRDLLANAVKYTRKKPEAEIEIGGRTAGPELVYWVKDNGVGFDMQYADKLFGVFQRLHRWEDYEGTGIGLANVQRVMERHSGRAWAEAQENRGATFYFALPKPEL